MRKGLLWFSMIFILLVVFVACYLLHTRDLILNDHSQLELHNFSAIATAPQKTEARPVDVLVVNSGGVLGIIPLHVLVYLEAKTGRPISSLFDLMVGTSTGAIIASGLDVPNAHRTAPQYSAQQILDIYRDQIPDIFKVRWSRQCVTFFGLLGPKFDSAHLYTLFNQLSGSLKISQVLIPLSFPAYDLASNSPIAFTSWETRVTHQDYRLSDALVGAVSAPMIFPPAKITSVQQNHTMVLVDGGTVASNPALIAYIAAKHLYPNRPIRLIELGTGVTTKLQIFAQRNPERDGLIAWSTHITDIAIYSQNQLIDRFMKLLIHQRDTLLIGYQRYDLLIPNTEYQAFNSQAKFLKRLDTYGDFLVTQSHTGLDALAKTLVADHRAPLGAQ